MNLIVRRVGFTIMQQSFSLSERPLLTFLKLANIEVAGIGFLSHGPSRSGYFFGAVLLFSVVSLSSRFNWSVPLMLLGSQFGSFVDATVNQYPQMTQTELIIASNNYIYCGAVLGFVLGVWADIMTHSSFTPTTKGLNKQCDG